MYCHECGTTEFAAAVQPGDDSKGRLGSERVPHRKEGFFRWNLVSVALHVLSIGYALFSFVDFWLAKKVVERGLAETGSAWYWGAFWNAVVAILCFGAWKLMKSRIRSRVLWGSFLVSAALFLIARTWDGGLSKGQNPFPIAEALLTWLPMLYVIGYGIRENRRTQNENSDPPTTE